MNKSIKITLCAAFCLLTVKFSFGQIKTFSGQFKGGHATYQYYERDIERIYNGAFSYTGGLSNYEVTEHRSIQGRFHENVKDGYWTYVANAHVAKGRHFNSTETAHGKYQDGFLEGVWSLKEIDNNSKQTVRQSVVNFSHGKLVGHFSFDFSIKDDLFGAQLVKIDGNFNNSGQYDGNWLILHMKNSEIVEDIRRYRNGKLYWRVERNRSTGEVLEKMDSTKTETRNIDSVDGIDYLKAAINVWLGNDKTYDNLNDFSPREYNFDNINLINWMSGDRSYSQNYTPGQ